MEIIYGIGLIVAFILAGVLFVIEGNDGEIGMASAISLLSWISVVLLSWRIYNKLKKKAPVAQLDQSF